MTHNHSMEMTDDDLELVSQYVANEMSPAEELAFERKLTNDEQFHARVFPFLDVWYDTEVWPNEPVVNLVELIEAAPQPVKQIRRVHLRLLGGASTLVMAAGIAFAMVMRTGVSPSTLPLAAHRDQPASAPVTAAQTPVMAARETPPTVSHVVAQSDNTFRAAKHALDSAFTRMVAANDDSVAQRMLAEVDRAGEPNVQFTPPQVGTVAAAQPIAPKVPFTVLVQSEALDPEINPQLPPQGGSMASGSPPTAEQPWWRRWLGTLLGRGGTTPPRGIGR